MPDERHLQAPFLDEPLTDHQLLREIWQRGNRIETRLEEVATQARLTNGRVSKLEGWRNSIIGGLAVVTAIVVPLFLAQVQK